MKKLILTVVLAIGMTGVAFGQTLDFKLGAIANGDNLNDLKSKLRVTLTDDKLNLVWESGKEFKEGGYDVLSMNVISDGKYDVLTDKIFQRDRYVIEVVEQGYTQYILIDYSHKYKRYNLRIPWIIDGLFTSYSHYFQ